MAMTRRRFVQNLCLVAGATLVGACERPDPPTLEEAPWEPAYAKLEAQGLFVERIEQSYEIMRACTLCPRRCGVNRLKGERGFCRAPASAMAHSHQPHFGEETPLVGQHGSGTIFFSNCNLRCVFCQNWPIAHEGLGNQISEEDLAGMMLNLQRIGCHNINVVTPTHVMPNILKATRIALGQGLHIPLCYNTSGYESVEIIKLLDGIVDIYLPDLKFMDGEQASRYNLAATTDYPERAQESLIEMHRQVGDLVTDERGIALRGLMVRHLVMPNRVAGTREFVQWVAENLSRETYVNIMSQYRVAHLAYEYETIARAITREEYLEAMDWATEAGLMNLDDRSLSQLDIFRRRMP